MTTVRKQEVTTDTTTKQQASTNIKHAKGQLVRQWHADYKNNDTNTTSYTTRKAQTQQTEWTQSE